MYGLDLHSTIILGEYQSRLDEYKKLKEDALAFVRKLLSDNGILVTAVEGRVKEEKSLAGKLELKGSKYRTIDDITDIVGLRVITFYSDDVDKIAALVEEHFEVDWANSIDKRKLIDIDKFGYMSLHYIVRMKGSPVRFEIQLRTALQHVWSNINHDAGYKTGIEVPKEYTRDLNRLAGLLDLADEQFSRIRKEINDYRRRVSNLVKTGNFHEVPLNLETFKSYLELNPFGSLLKRIAAINQAEVQPGPMAPYVNALIEMGFRTLADLEDLKKKYSDFAYTFARREIGATDLDIISSTVALQDLCIAYILDKGGGKEGLITFFDILTGGNKYNEARAQRILEMTADLKLT